MYIFRLLIYDYDRVSGKSYTGMVISFRIMKTKKKLTKCVGLIQIHFWVIKVPKDI